MDYAWYGIRPHGRGMGLGVHCCADVSAPFCAAQLSHISLERSMSPTCELSMPERAKIEPSGAVYQKGLES